MWVCDIIMQVLGVIFLVFIGNAEQRSTPQDDHYVAAVVEYAVNRDVEYNRLKYIELIAQAAEQNADIVVFPELTLTNASTSFSVPIFGLLKEHPIPAQHPELYDELLVAMSEAARDNEIYLVFNGQESLDCTSNDSGEECPEAKQYFFNTNVVIDRTGAVIDRYRKINLFGEYSRTPALHPDLGIFHTDFGVTFGHFICFDLMFQVPAIQVVQRHQLKDIVFTTMWFSEMPYLTAVQIQESYAYTIDVNFLASGANRPEVGSAGSGIYSGKAGALVSYMPGVSSTRLLVAKVPKVPGQVTEPVPGPIYDDPSDHDGLVLITDPSLTSHVSRLLVDGSQVFMLMDRDVSCNFRVNLTHASGAQSPRYRAVIQDGSNTYARREVGIAQCGVVACKDENFSSCTYRFDPKASKTRFDELEIEMGTYRHQYNKTLQCDNIVYFPVSFQTNKFPLSRKNVTFIDKRPDGKIFNHLNEINSLNEIQNGGIKTESCGREQVTFKINKPQDELVSFGIFGRTYTKDVDHNTPVTDEDIQKFNTILDIIYGGHYKYRATVFAGVRSFSGVETGGSRVCSIVACTGDTLDTCGKRFDTYTANATAVFEELSILAAYPSPVIEADLDADNSAVFPVALKSSIMPLEPEAYSYDVITGASLTYSRFTLNSFNEELYTFGVWGRVFATDGQEADPPLEEVSAETTPAVTEPAPTSPVTDSIQTTTPSAAYSHHLSGVLIPVLTFALRRK